jgi:predicted O-linked N-acetylglucosamine transferase (SPINDLY family)
LRARCGDEEGGNESAVRYECSDLFLQNRLAARTLFSVPKQSPLAPGYTAALSLYRRCLHEAPTCLGCLAGAVAVLDGSYLSREAEATRRTAASASPTRMTVWESKHVAANHAALSWRLALARLEPDVELRPALSLALRSVDFPATRELLSLISATSTPTGVPPVGIFSALHLTVSPSVLREIASTATHRIAADAAARLPPGSSIPMHRVTPATRVAGRLRVGYVSGQLRDTAMGRAIQSVFDHHDRERVEVFVYNVGAPADASAVYRRVRDNAEHFVQIDELTAAAGAERIAADHIDILVDVSMFDSGNRMAIFTYRPAPLQIAMIAIATTTGAADIYDYLVVDSVVVPAGEVAAYDENLLVMPHSYHVVAHADVYEHRTPRGWNARLAAADRAALGIPPQSVVLCNHCNRMRITERVFAQWMYILREVDGAVLLLHDAPAPAELNLVREAHRFGVRALGRNDLGERTLPSGEPRTYASHETRIFFAPSVNATRMTDQKSLCDLHLDTRPYTGHSTTADMLWAGVPVVTVPGSTLASRTAASMVLAAGAAVEATVASDERDYGARVIALASNRTALAAAQATLRGDARRSRARHLFATDEWVTSFESALLTIFATFMQGEAPQAVVRAPP